MPRYYHSHTYIAERFTGKPLTEIPPADFIIYSDDPPMVTIEDWYDYSEDGVGDDDDAPYSQTRVAHVGDWVTYSDYFAEGDFDNYVVYHDAEFREEFVPAEDD